MDLSQLSFPEIREYLAGCFVHLTRDDSNTDPNGQSALANFKSILDERMIRAIRPHCLHAAGLPPKQQREFRVACFSQIAVQNVSWIIGRGYKFKLEGFGFAFHRESLKQKGIQPVQYATGYGTDQRLRMAADRLFEINKKGNFTGDSRWQLPFYSAMHKRCDFAWENEWRMLGDVRFKLSDLICVIVPERFKILRARLKREGLIVVCAEWPPKQIVRELREQWRVASRVR
jgi:hypothetical protein